MTSTYEFVKELKARLDLIFDGRVWPQVLPDDVGDELPAATYARVSSPEHGVTHSGANGLKTERWQISSWAPNYDDALLKGEEVLQAFHGVIWGVMVGSSFVDDAMDDRDDTTGWDRVITDVIVTYN